MKILFDLSATQPNVSGKFHGGGKYGIVVFFELLKREADIECVWDSSKYIGKDVIEACKNNLICLHDICNESLENIIDNGKYDVYYSALPSYIPWFEQKKTRYIGTIHGLRGIEITNDIFFLKYNLPFKEKIKTSLKLLFPKRYRQYDKKKIEAIINQKNFSFITVSNHTKNSILANYSEVGESAINVFYSPSTSSKCKVKPYSLDKYFLLVSGNRPEKNALRALLAFDELFSERKEFDSFKVYITGANPNSYYHTFINKDKFHFLGYVSEEILDSLYAGAFCFIYPSLNEGFGYPPLEAMHYKVPVLASPFSSIYEVCNNAAIYFNPFSIKEIKARIIEIVFDSQQHIDYSNKGIERFTYITKKQSDDLKSLIDYILSSEN
jgi:glycosyltransferase involved in cell wall biosynthesis